MAPPQPRIQFAGPLAGDAECIVFPSGSTTSSRRPSGFPLFTGSTVTVTSSPSLNIPLLQPRLIISGGLLVSTTQCTTLPLASLTSNCKKQCGFAQNHFVTVPFMVTLLSESKAAFPWCAQSGKVTITTANAHAIGFTYGFFIPRPPTKNLRPTNCCAVPCRFPGYFPESKPAAGSANC